MSLIAIPPRRSLLPGAPSAYWNAECGYLPGNANQSAGGNNRTYLGADGLLKTAAANAPRMSYGQGLWANLGSPQNFDGWLQENAVTNALLQCRDLSNASWTKTSCTAAKDQTGIDGVANSASSLTATGANATCTQAVTLTSAQSHSFFMKRITGSGTIQVSVDNGSTFTSVGGSLSSSVWKRFVLTQVITNPTIVIKIVTSGDKIAVDFGQVQTDEVATSPIATTTAAASTVGDTFSQIITPALNPSAMSVLLRFTPYYTATLVAAARNLLSISDGSTSNRVSIIMAANNSAPTGRVTSGGVANLSGATIQSMVAGQESAIIISTNGGAQLSGTGYGAYILNDGGAAKVTGTTQTPPVGLTTLNLGCTDAGAAGGCFGAIREVAIYPFVIPGDMANRLTAKR